MLTLCGPIRGLIPVRSVVSKEIVYPQRELSGGDVLAYELFFGVLGVRGMVWGCVGLRVGCESSQRRPLPKGWTDCGGAPRYFTELGRAKPVVGTLHQEAGRIHQEATIVLSGCGLVAAVT